ncbi:hypothetical protein [Streptomyces sp. 8N616]|uniref:hypothetical protein n=1 Tax=Streptomyces sp. 8N616 TaxID=3457414 RepID=UPI003FD65EAF
MTYGGWGPPNGPGQGGPGNGGPYWGPPPHNPNPYPNPYPDPHPQPYVPPQPARRRSGCGCLAFAFAPAFVSARRRADAIFNTPGPGRIDDPSIRQVQNCRALVGAFATFLLIYTYGTDGGWSDVVDDSALKLFAAPWLLIFTGPLVVAGFIRYAPPEHRPTLRSRLRSPLKAVGWYLGALLLFIGCLALFALVMYKQGAGGSSSLLTSVMVLALFFPVVWLAFFLLFASGKAARYAFNTADVHAALPALLTLVLVWELTLLSVAVDGMPHGPLPVRLCGVLGGPLSVTGVALWELRRLRMRYGVRIRH